jgi:UDP-N-acetyl-2-amino-2-deoxyglucuronate dehydrogenase
VSRTLKMAIVGCGDIASYTALFARLNRRIQLTACCDPLPQRAEAFAARNHIPHFFREYERMLDSVALDAVYLAVPHHLHFEMAAEAIDRELHVLLEKPITRTLEEGKEITRQARARRARLGVNYQYRYDSGCHALARAVQAGELGEIYYVRCNIPFHRQRSYFTGASWHASLVQSGGGTLLTQGSHMLDIALWALGLQARQAMGMAARRRFQEVEVEDLAQGILEMENGALVQICSSMIANPEQSQSIEVYGERGTALYSDRPLPHVRFRGIQARKRRPPVRGLHALQRSIEGFRAWVMEDKPYLIPAEQALPVLAAVEAIYRSAQSGVREEVPRLDQP